MSEYVFRYANGFGGELDECDHTDNVDHYGTLHEEIVRCRDCIYYVKDPEPIDPGWPMMCERTGADMVEPYGYCAWGERKEVSE